MRAAGPMLRCLLPSGLLALGCGLFGPGEPPPGFEPTTSSYACSDFVLEVWFRHPEEITISGRGEVATLERGASRAGDRYRGGGFTFWREGEDRAFLQLPAGQIRSCFRIREAPPAA
jgi:membrane-bound inhibitor of C-type lysozyme